MFPPQNVLSTTCTASPMSLSGNVMLPVTDTTQIKKRLLLRTSNTPYKGRYRSANQISLSGRLFVSVMSIIHALSLRNSCASIQCESKTIVVMTSYHKHSEI